MGPITGSPFGLAGGNLTAWSADEAGFDSSSIVISHPLKVVGL